MPRLARVVIPGCAHHVTQRGNNRQDVFFVDDDRRAVDYPWSSAAAHCGQAADPTGLLDLARWAEMLRDLDCPQALRRSQDADEVASLRLATHRGRPLGSDSFLRKLETLLSRPLPVGRPRKKDQTRGGQ